MSKLRVEASGTATVGKKLKKRFPPGPKVRLPVGKKAEFGPAISPTEELLFPSPAIEYRVTFVELMLSAKKLPSDWELAKPLKTSGAVTLPNWAVTPAGRTSSLTQPNWQKIGNDFTAPSNGSFILTDTSGPVTPGNKFFYRVRILP